MVTNARTGKEGSFLPVQQPKVNRAFPTLLMLNRVHLASGNNGDPKNTSDKDHIHNNTTSPLISHVFCAGKPSQNSAVIEIGTKGGKKKELKKKFKQVLTAS